MIGKKTLNDYSFKNLFDYFNYIIDSEINGNYNQVKDLFKRLDSEQKKDFINYLIENNISNKDNILKRLF